MVRECSLPECDRVHSALGYCAMHYKRLLRNGDPRALQQLPEGSSTVQKIEHRSWRVTDRGCWEWSGPTNKFGYGTVQDGNQTKLTHRVAYEIWVGPIGNGQVCCHTCDNPPCINPDHLFLGYPADNVADMVNKGRDRKALGEASGNAKLTEAQVRDIRTRRANGEILRTIASTYDISMSLVSQITRDKSWKHVSNVEGGMNA